MRQLVALPIAQHVFGVPHLAIAEHVRVARDHFRGFLLRDRSCVEAPFVGSDLRVHRDLQQHVAKLFAKLAVVAGVDRLQQLVGLFEQVRAQRFVRLLFVPRAAVRCAKPAHDLENRRQAGGIELFRHRR